MTVIRSPWLFGFWRECYGTIAGMIKDVMLLYVINLPHKPPIVVPLMLKKGVVHGTGEGKGEKGLLILVYYH